MSSVTTSDAELLADADRFFTKGYRRTRAEALWLVRRLRDRLDNPQHEIGFTTQQQLLLWKLALAVYLSPTRKGDS